MPTNKPVKDMSIQDLIDQLEDAGRQTKDRVGELLEDAGLRTRFDRAVETIDEVRQALVRQLHDEPATKPLEEMTLDELHELASERELPGRSGMNKAELIDALRSK